MLLAFKRLNFSQKLVNVSIFLPLNFDQSLIFLAKTNIKSPSLSKGFKFRKFVENQMKFDSLGKNFFDVQFLSHFKIFYSNVKKPY